MSFIAIFKTLLTLAKENGCDYEYLQHFLDYEIELGFDGDLYSYLRKAKFRVVANSNVNMYSLNDLVLNFEEEETSFIYSLCKNREELSAETIKQEYIKVPTSERFYFIVDTFFL